mgnify:FL=1
MAKYVCTEEHEITIEASQGVEAGYLAQLRVSEDMGIGTNHIVVLDTKRSTNVVYPWGDEQDDK